MTQNMTQREYFHRAISFVFEIDVIRMDLQFTEKWKKMIRIVPFQDLTFYKASNAIA